PIFERCPWRGELHEPGGVLILTLFRSPATNQRGAARASYVLARWCHHSPTSEVRRNRLAAAKGTPDRWSPARILAARLTESDPTDAPVRQRTRWNSRKSQSALLNNLGQRFCFRTSPLAQTAPTRPHVPSRGGARPADRPRWFPASHTSNPPEQSL